MNALPPQPRGKQPFETVDDGEPWTLHDEGHRLDHICGVVFEGSIALTAGAAAIAVTAGSENARTLGYVLTGLNAVPALSVAAMLLYHPLSERHLARQRLGMRRKLRVVRVALWMVIVGVPALGLVAAFALFFPEQLTAALSGGLGAALLPVLLAPG